MHRRKFLKYTLAASFMYGLFHKSVLGYYPYGTGIYPNDPVDLGDSGIRTSRMAIGTGTNGWAGSSNQTRQLGMDGLPDLLKSAYDQGITFWDSADQYGSHPHLKQALRQIPREKITILTKTISRTREGVESDLNRFRKELGTDYIDIVLLHSVTDPNWNIKYQGAMDALSKARQKGVIRAHGISCHSIGALHAAAEEPWVMVDLARINPTGVRMDDKVSTVKRVLHKMKSNGKGIIAMKVYGAGQLANKKDEALRFMAQQDFIDAFTLGIEDYKQLNDIQARLPRVSAIS